MVNNYNSREAIKSTSYKLNQKFALSTPIGVLVGVVVGVVVLGTLVVAEPGMHWLYPVANRSSINVRASERS